MTAAVEAPVAPRFACLDGYRGLAALAVVVYHVLGRVQFHANHPAAGLYTSRLGDYGVNVFFMLSAFLLYRPFAVAALRGAPGPDLRRFAIRRVLRIVPAYWVALSVLLFATSYRTVHDLGEYLTYYGFAQIYRRGGYAIGGLGQAWSLCVEVSFYLALPLLAALGRTLWWGSRPTSADRRVRGQLLLVGLLVVGGLLFRWWALHSMDRFPTSSFWLPSLVPVFAAGMLLAVASAWVEVGGRLPAAVAALAERPWLSWGFAALAYWVLAMVRVPQLFQPVKPTESMYGLVFSGLSASFLLVPGTLGDERAPGIPAFLRSRPLFGLGLISYGTYLWHTLWIELFLELRDRGDVTGGFWAMFGFVALLTVASASASYLLVERPIQRLAAARRQHRPARHLRRRPPPPEDAAALPAVVAPSVPAT